MKHRISITILILAMFLVTQGIGLFVVGFYNVEKQEVTNPDSGEVVNLTIGNELPYGLEAPEDEKPNLISLIFSFALAIALIFVLMRYQWKWVIRGWFFFVVVLALSISLNAFFSFSSLTHISIIALAVAIPLGFLKVFRPDAITHNLTELLIYPGIAAVIVPILSPVSMIILLFLISLYDMWAVWKSGIMMKMAKFQMEEVKVFGGFLIPAFSKKDKIKIQEIKQKYKGKKIPSKVKNQKFKVNLAILGGGDVVFPIITAGVFMRYFGLNYALFVVVGAFLGLTYLMFRTEKDKAYPAMPYISVGIFIGLILSYLLL